MSGVRLERDGDVSILHLGDGENRFDRDFVDGVLAALDEVAADGQALVTTASGKIWSNGLDLDWMGSSGAGADFVRDVQRMMARVLLLPVPTVAAIGGHAFAGGAMLALAHEVRIMRADRGFFCLPEVDIGLPFTPGMAALVQCRIGTTGALRDVAIYGERIGGKDAAWRGIVDEAVPGEEVLLRALARARALAGKDRATLGVIKERFFGSVAAALTA
jgi:enoyl-CoA hydratase/carnithine racemase